MERRRGGGGDNRPKEPRDGRRDGQQCNGNTDGSAFAPSDLQSNDSDPGARREIRNKYRDLINSMQENREDLLNPSNNRLTEVLEEANNLFKDVRQAREAALDAQLLVVASDLGKEKASQMLAHGAAFDTATFTERLLSFMGINRLEDDDDEEQNGGASEGYLPPDAWHKLTSRAECCFRTAPSFHFMKGSFHAEPPPPKPKVVRQARAPTKETTRAMPTQMKKMLESHQEATEKEVERILGYLRGYHQQDPSTPISYYEFVIDPNSFSRTVENIFHTSFLVRDGLAKMFLDDDRLPCIAPVEDEEGGAPGPPGCKQCIVSISPKMWKDLIDGLDIKTPLIQTPASQTQ